MFTIYKLESKAQLYTLVEQRAQHDFLYLPYRYCRVLHRFASYLFEELYKWLQNDVIHLGLSFCHRWVGFVLFSVISALKGRFLPYVSGAF